MIAQIFRYGKFVYRLFPQTEEAVEVIRENHPAKEGWEVKLMTADTMERE